MPVPEGHTDNACGPGLSAKAGDFEHVAHRGRRAEHAVARPGRLRGRQGTLRKPRELPSVRQGGTQILGPDGTRDDVRHTQAQ